MRTTVARQTLSLMLTLALLLSPWPTLAAGSVQARIGEIGAADLSENAGTGSASRLLADVCFAEIDGDNSTDFSSADASAVQDAIDAAPSGATVKVAGTCAGVQVRSGITQTAYISHALTLRGGYTTTNWLAAPDPDLYPTILDAQGLGRVVTIADPPAVGLIDLTLTGGSAVEGGGLYATFWMSNTFTLRNTRILSNTAETYGGLYVRMDNFGHFDVTDNLIQGNEATVSRWGGFYLQAQNNAQGHFDRNRVVANQAVNDYGGGELDLEGNVTTTFDDNEIRDNVSGISTGGIYLDLEDLSRAVGNRLVVENNTAAQNSGGMSVGISDGAALTLTHGLTVTGNVAGSNGGGIRIYAAYSRAYVANMILYNNRALAGSGGGFYLTMGDAGSQFTLPNTTVISNTAGTNGGGGYASFDDGSLVDLTGSTFADNHAGGSGGGIYNSSFDEGSSLFLDYTRFLSNTANSDGGGAYVDLPSELGSLEASYMEVISNTVGRNGGGIYAGSGDYGVFVNFDYNLFEGNVAGNNGGGVYMGSCEYGCTKSVDDNTFVDNHTLAGDGGAFYQSVDFASYGSDATFDRNRVISNTAGNSGGGLYVSSDFAEDGASGSFQDNVVAGNTAGGSGGGIYISSKFAYDGSHGWFNSNTIMNNTSGSQGGGVYMTGLSEDGSTAQFNDNWIEGNRSNGNGGGVRMYDAADSAIAEIARNSVIDNAILGNGDGGGLYIYDFGYYGSQVRFLDNVVSGNVISGTSGEGGGLHIEGMGDGDVAWFIGNTIADNVAPGDGGGLMWNDDVPFASTLYFEQNDLLRNVSGQDGGGCFFDYDWKEGGLVVFNDNRVNDNTALRDYGGCFLNGLSEKLVYMLRNEINDNTAGRNAGGIFFEDIEYGTEFHFWDNEIIGNRAGISGTLVTGGDGGGLWFERIEYGTVVDMRGNQVLSNTAYLTLTGGVTPTGGSYAGVYAYLFDGSLLTMEQNTIAGNAAGQDFGSVHVALDQASRAVLEQNLIQNNDAAGLNAGVVITGVESSQYYLRRNRILDHDGTEGYGVWVHNGDAVQPLWGESENNLVVGSSSGGVYLHDADWHSLNDTVADNGAFGLMMTGTLTSTAYLSNTLLWGQTWSFTRTGVVTYTDRFTMAATTSDIQGGWPGTGNLDVEPLFAGAGDYHLQETSPLVGAAETAVAPPVDLDGVPRPVPTGGDADIGAYEWFRAGVFLPPASQSDTGLPGMIVTHTLTITNDGNVDGWFDLDVVTGTLGWSVDVDSPVWLAAGDSTVVEVAVTVPVDEAAGATNVATMRVTAQHDTAVIALVAIETTAAQVAGVQLAPDGSGGGFVGSTVVHAHTLTNEGNGTDTFTLSASSSEGWAVRLSRAAATLAAGESTTLLVYVTVPSQLSQETTDNTTVTATSTTTGTVSDSAVDTTVGYPWPYRVYLPLVVSE